MSSADFREFLRKRFAEESWDFLSDVAKLKPKLQKLKQRFSMVIVEQNKEFLDGLADAVLRMENGRIQGTEEGANGRAQ